MYECHTCNRVTSVTHNRDRLLIFREVSKHLLRVKYITRTIRFPLFRNKNLRYLRTRIYEFFETTTPPST